MALRIGIFGAIVAGVTALLVGKLRSRNQQDDRFDDITADPAILSDRISFKLLAAQNHLDKLKSIQRKYGHIMGRGRIYAEMELDCYFAQIIGAKDSLLMKINEKVGLGIDEKEVSLNEVHNRLKSKNKEDLVKELRSLSRDKTSWFWLLNELRNHSIHRNMLSKQVSVSLFDDVNTGASSDDIVSR